MTTLVLSNHIPAIESALLKANHPVIVCMTADHARLRGPAHRLPYPVHTVSGWEAWDEIGQIATRLRGQITSVATRWEGAVIAAGFIRDLLGLPGQSAHDAVGYVDKAIMKERLASGGVPVARHRVVSDVADIYQAAPLVGGWPVVIKPLKGFASTNTHVISSPRQLAEYIADGLFDEPIPASDFYAGDPAFQALAQHSRFLVEEYVDIDREYHCDGLWSDGEPVYQLPGLYHTPPLRGMGGMLGSVLLPLSSREGQIVAELADRAARVLGAGTGFTHAEVYRTSTGQWLFGEIASRPGGGGIQPALQHAYGIDVAYLQGQVAIGKVPPVTLTRRPAHPVVGWAGPAVPPGRLVEIAAREKLLEFPGVVDATVAVQPGQSGGRTGSGLWGGLAGYVFLEGDTPGQVLAMMKAATDRYEVRVADQPELATR